MRAHVGELALELIALLLEVGGLGFSAPLPLPRVINLLQHVRLRGFEVMGRRVELGAKGGITSGDRVLEFGGLLFLLLANGLELLGAVLAHGGQLLLERMRVTHGRIFCRRFRAELLAQLGQVMSQRAHLLAQAFLDGLELLAYSFGGREPLVRGRQVCFQLGAALLEHALALLDGQDPQRAHAVGDDGRPVGLERLCAGLIVLPVFELVVDGGAATLGNGRVDQIDRDRARGGRRRPPGCADGYRCCGQRLEG